MTSVKFSVYLGNNYTEYFGMFSLFIGSFKKGELDVILTAGFEMIV